MRVTMKAHATRDTAEVKAVVEKALGLGLRPEVHESAGAEMVLTEIHMIDGDSTEARSVPTHVFSRMEGVESVERITPNRLSLEAGEEVGHHRVWLGADGGAYIGRTEPCRLVAGQCTVDRNVDEIVGKLTQEHGVTFIRGGCWKPRSSAYSFPGFGKNGVEWLLTAATKYGVEAVFIEVIDSTHIDDVRTIRDFIGYTGQIVLWVGARTRNLVLLQKLGRQHEFPVMLKNPIDMQSVSDWMGMVEFVTAGERYFDDEGQLIREKSAADGNTELMLCSRGVIENDPESSFRFAPKHTVIETVHDRYWVPIGVDPSHSAGTMRNDLVLVNLRSALVHRPDFAMVEVYLDPETGKRALCDAEQAVPLARTGELIDIIVNHNKETYPDHLGIVY